MSTIPSRIYKAGDYDIYMNTENVGHIAPILPLFLKLHKSISMIKKVLGQI